MELGLLTCSFLSKPFLLVCEELSICVNNRNPNLNPYSGLMVNWMINYQLKALGPPAEVIANDNEVEIYRRNEKINELRTN